MLQKDIFMIDGMTVVIMMHVKLKSYASCEQDSRIILDFENTCKLLWKSYKNAQQFIN